jgi:hypothetical protein
MEWVEHGAEVAPDGAILPKGYVMSIYLLPMKFVSIAHRLGLLYNPRVQEMRRELQYSTVVRRFSWRW